METIKITNEKEPTQEKLMPVTKPQQPTMHDEKHQPKEHTEYKTSLNFILSLETR